MKERIKGDMENKQRINCVKCKHYFVTWDQHAPKGCKAFGFKSIQLPSMIVLQSSGQNCMKFDEKK
ncbi:uracil-DNA glycosylase [Bacillus sp. JJ722]|uniref:uracil-DNA glycosylase n=1 Tax=Bacillus sp. JJ722 TaxID=3122973 RepID=UPI002FFFB305